MNAERIDVLAVMDNAAEHLEAVKHYGTCDELKEARAAVAELIEENKRLQVKANLWDDLLAARRQTKEEPDSVEWKRLARQGDAISAIKACRSMHGYSLREAKDCVESYMGRGAP